LCPPLHPSNPPVLGRAFWGVERTRSLYCSRRSLARVLEGLRADFPLRHYRRGIGSIDAGRSWQIRWPIIRQIGLGWFRCFIRGTHFIYCSGRFLRSASIRSTDNEILHSLLRKFIRCAVKQSDQNCTHSISSRSFGCISGSAPASAASNAATHARYDLTNLPRLAFQDILPTARRSHRCEHNAPPEDMRRLAARSIVGTISFPRQARSIPPSLSCRRGPEVLLGLQARGEAGMPVLTSMTISAS
jgi:hypothetical protein